MCLFSSATFVFLAGCRNTDTDGNCYLVYCTGTAFFTPVGYVMLRKLMAGN
jgi:hypothetical protein